MNIPTLILTALWIINNGAEAANILAFLPVPYPSQIKGLQPLFVELAKRGHNMTVVTPYPIDVTFSNYNQIVVPDVSFGRVDFRRFIVNDTFRFVRTPFNMWNYNNKLVERVLQIPQVQSIIHSHDLEFDLVMVEQFYQEALMAIGHKFKAPVIGLTPVPLPSELKWAGVPINPSYIPDIGLGFALPMTFIERFKNAVCTFVRTFLGEILFTSKQEEIMNTYFNYTGWESRPPLTDMLRDIALHLVHSDSALFHARPYPANVVEISGMHINENQELPEDLQKVMDDAKHGVVYFSLGSVVKWQFMPKERLEMFVKVFSRLKQVVLWKYDADTLPPVSSNVVIRKWFPQTAVLKHPNCQLFLTHGGLHSLLEAVHFAVPLLGFPLFADQESNMAFATRKGYAKATNLFHFTETSLLSDINTLLYTTSFQEATDKISALYHDRPMSPMDTAIYWIEYVLRNKRIGADLRPASVYNPWYYSYHIDLIAFSFTLLITLFLILRSVFRFLYRSLKSWKGKRKQL